MKAMKIFCISCLSLFLLIFSLPTKTQASELDLLAPLVVPVLDAAGSIWKAISNQSSAGKTSYIQKVQKITIKLIKQKHNVNVKFGKFYEERYVNEQSKLLAYHGKWGNIDAFIILAFKILEGNKIKYVGCLGWEACHYDNTSTAELYEKLNITTRRAIGPLETPIQTASSYTPKQGDARNLVIVSMGRAPDDQFELKGADGAKIDDAEMVAYFTEDNGVLLIGLINNKVRRWQKYADQSGYQAYKNKNAFALVDESTF